MKLTFDLQEALALVNPDTGIKRTHMEESIRKYLAPFCTQELCIKLDDEQKVTFFSYMEHGKTVLICEQILCSYRTGLAIEKLPQILSKLAEQNCTFDVLQFAHGFKITDRITNKPRRSHLNLLAFFREQEQIKACLIDSSLNSIGVSNPFKMFSHSLISGKELLSNKLERLLADPVVAMAFQQIYNVKHGNPLVITTFTGKQPLLGDKRCGIYVLKAMAELTHFALQTGELTHDELVQVTTEAFEQLNAPEEHYTPSI